jgi:hypothetical protein
MLKISPYLGVEQRILFYRDCIAVREEDLFSEISFGILNSEVSGDGRKDESPLRGAPKSPGIRYTTNVNTTIIRKNLKVPI